LAFPAFFGPVKGRESEMGKSGAPEEYVLIETETGEIPYTGLEE